MSEVPKIWGTLGPLGGVVDPLERRPFYLTCYHAKFGCSRSNRMGGIYGATSEKFDLSHPAFQGHSRSWPMVTTDHY